MIEEKGTYKMENCKNILKGTEYRFIRTNEHLGRHVILLGLAGSYSYGTNIETSDIDITDYPVVTLCGSTRFKKEFMEVQKRRRGLHWKGASLSV